MEFLGSFEMHDLFTIATLALLEGILSVDNALVLAILVKPLAPDLRKKALKYGIWGAFIFRILAVIFAAYLVKFTLFKLIGGIYLVYLATKHMFFGFAADIDQSEKRSNAGKSNFWKIIFLVEMTDIVFSIDSITTAVAFSDKLWVLWFGGICGIVLMRFLSGYFVRAIEKFPKLEDLAYQLVFFVGIKLSFETLGVHIDKAVFWLMMAVIMTIGLSLIVRDHKSYHHTKKRKDVLIDRIKSGELKVSEALAEQNLDGALIAWLYKEGYLKEMERK